MLSPPLPVNEAERLAALHALHLLDTPPEERFDRITRLAQGLFNVPIVAICLVDANRQWFKSQQGLSVSETPRDISLCGHAILQEEPLVIPDISLDPRFSDNPLVTGDAAIRFYAGYPLSGLNRTKLGTLCILDRRPREMTTAELKTLGDLAAMVENELYAAELNQALEVARGSQETLQKSQKFLQTMVNHLPVAVFAKNAEDGRFVLWNKASERLFGLTAEQALGGTDYDFFPKEQADFFRQKDRETFDARRVEDIPEEPINSHSLGKRVLHTVKVPVFDDYGAPLYLLGISEDITERKRAEQALQESEGLVRDLRRQLSDKARFQDLIGKSKAMNLVFQQIQQLAKVDSSVLIEGETGTGKELVARAIHFSSRRKQKPFIAVNCAGLTDSILGSQLFGHKKGAFTGAIEDQQGVFEAAEGGALLLDEIGGVSPNVQASLLRVLQEREITRLGESKPKKIDVRVLVATHHNLSQDVLNGAFRADLLYRIRVARIQLPPLRERREDIPLLVASFLEHGCAMIGKSVHDVSSEAMGILMDYMWPGNVRELKSAIECALIRCDGPVIEANDLPPEILEASGLRFSADSQEKNEKTRLVSALQSVRGNREAAARLLGISRATLYRRLAELKSKPDR